MAGAGGARRSGRAEPRGCLVTSAGGSPPRRDVPCPWGDAARGAGALLGALPSAVKGGRSSVSETWTRWAMFFSAARGGVRLAEKRALDRRAQPGVSLSWEDVKRSPEGACDGGRDAAFRTGRSLHRHWRFSWTGDLNTQSLWCPHL